MSLLVKASREGQTIARVTPESAGWGMSASRRTGWMRATSCMCYEAAREVCIVVLTGTVTIEAGDTALGVDRLARQRVRGCRAVRGVFAARSSPRSCARIATPRSAWRARRRQASIRRG